MDPETDRGHNPSSCEIGDLYRPWFVFKSARTGCPKDVNQACLVCKVEQLDLDPEELVVSSFTRTTKEWMESCLDLAPRLCWKGEEEKDNIYYWPSSGALPGSRGNLVKSIKEKGQQERIICTKHYAPYVSTQIEFLEDPELTKIRIFEGHHRAAACSYLGVPVKADVYHLYHMDTPIDWPEHYSSVLDIMRVSESTLKDLIKNNKKKTDNPFRRAPHYFFGTPIT